MQSRFKEGIFQRITETLPARPYYPASMLSGPDLPADIGHFLSQTLRRRALLEGDLIINRSSDWFDFDTDPVQEAINGFLQTLSHEARFPQEAFDRILRTAIHSCADYLIDPAATLAGFAVTDRSDDNRPADVRRRAGYFLHYGYLLASVESFLTQFTGEQVQRDRLLNHLIGTETKNVGAESVDDWILLLAPLMKAGHFAFDQRASVPVELVETFFERKQKKDLADAVHALKSQHGELVTSDQLASALKKVLDPEPIRPISAPRAVSSAVGGGKGSQGDLPLWKQYAQEAKTTNRETPVTPPGKAASEPLWRAYRNENDTDDAIVSNTVEKPAEPVNRPQPVVSFQSEIESRILGKTASERDRFVRDLFSGNRQEYTQSLERLASVGDWETASKILLNEVYRRFEVDIYSETAITFTNAVERGIKQRS